MDILKALASYTHAVTFVDLAMKAVRDRDICSRRAARLAKYGYVVRLSERGGVAITDKGRVVLNSAAAPN